MISKLSFLTSLAGGVGLLVSVSGALADVKLPQIFSDHMVLERSSKVPVWGWADPGEKVTVALAGKTASATAGKDGKWMANLNLSLAQPGPFEMSVEGKNKLKVEDVVIGEVWLASGQSNMEWRLETTNGAAEEIAKSANPKLRMFQQEKIALNSPTDVIKGVWLVAGPTTLAKFSAAGYYFGKRLQQELNVPVGIINCNWGGTHSESWTSAEALRTVPDLKASSEQQWASVPAFPEKLKQFLPEFREWLKTNGREDPKSADPALFAGLDVSTEGWVPVKLPGKITGEGLPIDGVIWLRKDMDFPTKPGGEFRITIGEADRFDAFYWNGKLIKEYTYENYSSIGPRRIYVVPPSEIVAGKNVAALRVYVPANGPETINVTPYGAPFPNPYEWLAKAEMTFPDLPAGTPPAPITPVPPPYPQLVPSANFNGMINPLIPYAIKGVIWYQGEANAGRAYQYRTAFPLLINDWRARWGQGNMPFYFCQLANMNGKRSVPVDEAWAELREAQSLTLKLPNTAQAVLIDIGESGDVHPRNKKDVGERLALIALARDYGKKNSYSGPVYKSMKIEGDKIAIDFDQVGKGLVAKPVEETYIVTTPKRVPLVRNSPKSQLEGFAICGEDKKWVWADAKIRGNQVVVWSDQVKAPIAVRYAWADNPTTNLSNDTGLPASPFRTDDFPGITQNNKF